MDQVFTTDEMLALLDWYREMGATHAVDEVAVDWRTRSDVGPGKGFKYPERTSPQDVAIVAAPSNRVSAAQFAQPVRADPVPTFQATAPAPRLFPSASPDEASHAARDQARSARTLHDLRHQLEIFDGCALKSTAKNLCFYRGPEKARLMVIGEAPGRDEDIAGKPFVGLAGQLLDRMLAAIGESEASVHITNIVYWRPPGNRTPTPLEGQICRPFLERQIELVSPEIVLLLGGAAAKHMLNTPEGIMKLRGTWREIEVGDKRLRTMASLHPAYLLRTPAAKRQAWQDLLAVKLALGT
jgi:uracil-DNA glycosylase